MGLVTERAAATIGSFPGGYKVLGPGGQTVCEVMVPFGATPGETVDRIVRELRTLQSLQPVIDEVIAHVFGRTHGIIGCPSRGKQKGTLADYMQLSSIAYAVLGVRAHLIFYFFKKIVKCA